MKITKWRIVLMPDNTYVVEEAKWNDKLTEFVWVEMRIFTNHADAFHYTRRYPRIVKHN